MKKILLIIGISSILGSCNKKNLTSLNDDPKSPVTSSPAWLFSNAQLNLANNLATPSVNVNIFRMLAQHWTETTYIDESDYDLATRNIPQTWWHILYRDVLNNFEEAKRIINASTIDANVKKNQLAMIEIMQVFTYHYIITTFGNIPYSDALDINKIQPKYDDAKTVYDALIIRLDAAIANLNSAASFGTADLLFGGNAAAWKKFANSFKMKMGMLIADSDPTKSKTVVESAAAAGVFTSNDDNAVFHFLGAPPNTNPVWVNLVQSGRKDFVAANTLVDEMSNISDPRIPLYFTKDADGNYSGGEYGEANNYSTFSKPSLTIQAPDFPTWFMDYAEVEFLLAEAKERGYTVSGTAASHYNNGVTASIEFWGGKTSEATAYLGQSVVAYATAFGTYKQKIGFQKWIALYERGHDAWTEWRRLDYPNLVPSASALSDIPLRFTYPVSEQNVNGANYKAASTAIGGDKVEIKLWFDKN